MTRMHRGIGVLMVLAAAGVGPQALSAQTMPQTREQGRVHAAPVVDLKARIATLDARIALLTEDMRMFAGELKIQTMAELIEALVERQRFAGQELKLLDERMRDLGIERPYPAPLIETDPDEMCSPFI